MSYETPLHRSFDYQLSPVPSSVIDWAGTRRAQRTVMPSSSAAGGAAVSPPLVEVKTQTPWKVRMSELETAASLESRQRAQQQQQQQQQQRQLSLGSSPSAIGHSGQVDRRPETAAPAGHQPPTALSGAATNTPPAAGSNNYSQASHASMYYYVEESEGGDGGAAKAAAAAAVAKSGPSQPGTYAQATPGVRKGAVTRNGAPALVMYPTDGSVYAASSPEGEMLGLYSATSSSLASPAAPGQASGDSATAASAERSDRKLLGPSPPPLSSPAAKNPGNGIATASTVNGNGDPSVAALPAVSATKPQSVMVNAVTPLLQLMKDVAESFGGGADLAGSRGPLEPSAAVSLSDYVWSSHGSTPVWHKGSFALTAGVYAAFGFTQTQHRQMRDVRRPAAAADGAHVREGIATALLRDAQEAQLLQVEKHGRTAAIDVGTVDGTSALRVMNVVQLEWFWARWRWQGVLNVRLLPPAQHTRVPLCEYVMRTPWTEWSVQSDELVFNWSGFLTLYQQRIPQLLLEREQCFLQGTDAATVAVGHEHGEEGPQLQEQEGAVTSGGSSRNDGAKSAKEIAKELVDKKREEKQKQKQKQQSDAAKTENETAASRHPSTRNDTAVAHRVEGKSAAPCGNTGHNGEVKVSRQAAAVGTTGEVDSSHPTATTVTQAVSQEDKDATAPSAQSPASPRQQKQQKQQQQEQFPLPVLAPHAPHWWMLRHLKIGAGISVKNDLASGINLYWGCSGQMGRGLSFSGHVDVLRRMCCAVSSSLGPLDLSVRLRMNLITYHSTALDAGVCYRPFARYPNTILRASTSATGRCVGVQVDDLTHEFFSGWIASHADQRVARKVAEQQFAVVGDSERATSERLSTAAAPHPHSPTSGSNASTAPAQTKAGEVPSTVLSDSHNSSEGGWISFGPVTSAWGYLRGSGKGPKPDEAASMQVAQQQKQQQEEEAAAAAAAAAAMAARPFTVRAAHFVKTTPQHLAALPRQWSAALAEKFQPPAAVRERLQGVAGTVGRVSSSAWREVRQLDWLEAALDGARVDVSVGITQDPNRPREGIRSFLVVSAH